MTSLVESLIEYHMQGPFEIIAWTLLEDSGWSVGETKAYRKGYNKYQTDARVMQSLHQVISFVTNQTQQPRITEYPTELYVHALSIDKRFDRGTLWCHLKGQKIGFVFKPDYDARKLELLALGTHQDLGWR